MPENIDSRIIGDFSRRFSAYFKLEHLISLNKISLEEHKSLCSMINSDDITNLVVAEEILKNKPFK